MAKKNNRPKTKPTAKPVPNEPATPQIIEEAAPLPAESAPRVSRAPKLSRSQAAADVKGPLPRALDTNERDQVQSRMVSLLAGQPGVKTLDLPKPATNDPRPFEVVGIPLSAGFHVVEIASPMLGAALLDERHGTPRTMVVRTSALVTNLGVHFKLGRENALAWVTTLDRGRPVAESSPASIDLRARVCGEYADAFAYTTSVPTGQ